MISNRISCELSSIFGNKLQRKMANHLALLVIISLSLGSCQATSNCEQKVGLSYLDGAVDMITKAKQNFSTCVDCKNYLSKGALDCSELLQMGHNKSGVYKIWPASRITDDKSLDVYCDMQTSGGGWTLIQRRGNFHRAEDYFHKDWKSYKAGFGDIEKDFWLGNDKIFALSNQKLYSVRFDLKDVEGNSRYAQYDAFWIDDENQQFTLHIEDYKGDAGDSMESHNNRKFSTKDQDNDKQKDEHCAQLYKGAWWYDACHAANLNGLYKRGKQESFADGVNWKTWKGYHESLESTEIKIRPKSFRLSQVSQVPPDSSRTPM